jgi:hypothetical protein
MPMCIFHHDVSTPGLPEDKGSYPISLAGTERVDHIKDIIGDICHVISAIGFIAEAMTAKVNRCDCMAQFGKASRWTIPQPSI